MTRRRAGIGIRIDVDDRTAAMSDRAIMCRTLNHSWDPIPQGRARRQELARLGQAEGHYVCNRCTATKTVLYDTDNGFTPISSKTEYPENYLLTEKGGGRLPRPAACAAMFDRLSLV